MSRIDPWRQHVPIVSEAYKLKNYKINYTGNKTGYCYIYCSSNDIWYPNEREIFEESIIKKNYFEWTHLKSKNAEKEIFLRDIYKSWYVTGINSSVCDIPSLVEFIQKETEGYKTVVIGSSAGGFLATVLGIQLDVEHVLVFSAQFNLRNKWAMGVNPFLKKYEREFGKYYDLSSFLHEKKKYVFYICPINNENDQHQFNTVEKCDSVRILKFNSCHHGVVLLRSSIQVLLDMNKYELEELFDKFSTINVKPIVFSIYLAGLLNTVTDIRKKIMQHIKRRWCKK